jgi:myo-inositol-1-phosphate synthase
VQTKTKKGIRLARKRKIGREREKKSVVEKEVDDTYVVDHYKVIKYLKTEKERKLSRLLT